MRGRSLVWGVLALLAAAAVAWRLRASSAPAGGGDDVPAGESSGEPHAAPGLRGRAGAATVEGPQAALLPDDAQPRPFSRGPLRVRVTVEDEPRAGVTVRLRAADDLQPVSTARTDASGIARFAAVDRSRVVAEVLAEGFRPASTEAQGFEEEEDGVVTLALEPGVRVEGRVVDAEGGAGLAGARVVARLATLAVDIGPADATGHFVLPGLGEESTARIVASAPGRKTDDLKVTVKDGQVVPAAPLLRLARGTALVGVVRSSDGAPVAGAEVTVAARTRLPVPEPEKTSDGKPYVDSMDRFQGGEDDEPTPPEGEGFRTTSRENGAFRVEGLAFDGVYDLWLRHPESVTARKVLQVPMRSAGDTGPVALVAFRPAVVRLTVSTPPDRPVKSDARIRLFQGPFSSAPDASPERGQYHFLDVVPGPVVAYVGAPGYLPAVVRGTANEGGTLDLALTLESKGTISGVVLDESERPLSQALVEIGVLQPETRPPRFVRLGSETTDADGRFEFWDPPDDAVLVAHWTGRAIFRTREPLTVQRPLAGLRVVLFRRGSLRLRLVMPQGGTFEGAAWAQLGFHLWPHRITAEAGVLEASDLDDGQYDLLVVPPGWAWMRRVVTIREGGAVDLGEVVLDPGTAIVGRVLDASGRPVEGALIHPTLFEGLAYSNFFASDDRSAYSDAEGRFRLEHVPRGETVELGVSATGYTQTSIQGVGGAGAPVEARLQRQGLLQGQVRGAGGLDVRDARIELRPAGAAIVRVDDEEYVEGSQSIDVDDGGRFEAWLPPGTWTAVWIDDAHVAHTLGEWTLKAGESREVTLSIPGR